MFNKMFGDFMQFCKKKITKIHSLLSNKIRFKQPVSLLKHLFLNRERNIYTILLRSCREPEKNKWWHIIKSFTFCASSVSNGQWRDVKQDTT